MAHDTKKGPANLIVFNEFPAELFPYQVHAHCEFFEENVL